MITTAETRRYSQKAPMVIYENPSMVQENGTDTENSGVYFPENENNLELVSVSNTSSPTRSRHTAKSSTSTDRICDVDSVLVDDRSD